MDERQRQQNQDPYFAETAANLTVAEGRTATLPCVVENLGNYRLAWIHKDRHNLLTLHDQVITMNPACPSTTTTTDPGGWRSRR
ncbi:hypothetical protein CEXT_455051 [Caerostris extrusa]|uniref:Ig-like domain-containing protein n=1 Tax=Caerostris extrusa TaxID=172846 RepID=A0AAV4PF48_CAEEX|nr:hypothetical protein CEXT_455051 [Caerostris extrusa]